MRNQKQTSEFLTYLLLLLVVVILFMFFGCEEDNPAEPVKTLSGRYAITLNGTTTLSGVLNLTEVSGTLSGSLTITGFGQAAVNGNSTNSTVNFYFYSQEQGFRAKWILSGSHDYTNMSGSGKVFNDDTGSQVATLSWSARKD